MSREKSINILENMELKKYSTFYVGGICRYFIEINQKEELAQVFDFINFKKAIGEIDNFYILGMGSNTIFSDNLSRFCILKINIKNQNSFEILNKDKIKKERESTKIKETEEKIVLEKSNTILVKAYAGDVWDDLVLFCCKNNYFGLENLSYIPGYVGAVPVQNIGAYGVEVKDYISSVEVYNIEKNIFEILENETEEGKHFLDFGYRDSIFKKNKNKYIILSIDFKINKERNKSVKYDGLEAGESDDACSIREKIINIRKSKLPEWRDVSNCGSFFKNPLITKKDLDFVLSKNKNIKSFEVLEKSEIRYKISAAQIIDSLNLKGLEMGGAKISPNHALIIINENKKATFQNVFDLSGEIINRVFIFYGIILEREVNMI